MDAEEIAAKIGQGDLMSVQGKLKQRDLITERGVISTNEVHGFQIQMLAKKGGAAAKAASTQTEMAEMSA